MICEINTGIFPVNKKSVQGVVDKCAKIFKIKNGELSIAFISNKDIKRWNKLYRKIDKATDVLSFGSLKISSPLSQRGGRGYFSEGKNMGIKFDFLSRAFIKSASESMVESRKLYRAKNPPVPPRPAFAGRGGAGRPPLEKGVNNAYAEILISYEIAKKQAKENKITIKKEIERLLIHGILHLLGYDHEKDKEADEMEKLEEELLHSPLSRGDQGCASSPLSRGGRGVF